MRTSFAFIKKICVHPDTHRHPAPNTIFLLLSLAHVWFVTCLAQLNKELAYFSSLAFTYCPKFLFFDKLSKVNMDFKAKKMIEEDVSPLRYKIFIWMAAQRIAWQSEVYSTQPTAFRATKRARRSTTS